MPEGPTRVLFIAGAGRSGSTILHNVLGQVDGFAAVGEVRELWQRGVLGNWLCGCGDAFARCQTWTCVWRRMEESGTAPDPDEVARFTERFRIKHLPLTLIPYARQRRLDSLRIYLDQLGDLYTAIRQVTDATVIVDSSKNPSYGYLLGHVPNLDVAYLHFVRDGRAVSHSWAKQKMFEPGRPMPRKSFIESALQWNARNLATELFLKQGDRRTLRVRYEDLMANPRQTVGDIVRWVDGPETTLPFTSSHEVVLAKPIHSVFGNEVRFQRGAVRLERDDRWVDDMEPWDRRLVAGLTAPLRWRYGYGHIGSAADIGSRRAST